MFKIKYGLLLGFIFLLSGCGGYGKQETPDGALGSEAAKVYGASVNMRNGGLAEGDENGIFYVWDGKLMHQKPGQEAEIADENGAEYLCLTPETLYYVSRNEEGERGIYARKNAASSKRELLLAEDARYLYAYNGFLYYINYPKGADVCRLRLEDGRKETIAEGSYDGLIVTKDALFYRDIVTKQYLRSAFNAEGGLDAGEVWIAYTEDLTPFSDDEWIYYDLGDFFYHYKVSLTDKTSMGRHSRISDDMFIWDGQKYEKNQKTDLNTGEQIAFTQEAYTELVGIAGNELLYAAYDYAEEALLTENPVAGQMALYAYDLASGETRQIAERKVTESITTEEAVLCYERLMQGELTLLKKQAESFAARFLSPEQWKYYDTDLDDDGIPERFLFSDSKESIILHADWDGVSLYQTDFANAEEWYEPLDDQTVLYQYEYKLGGYGSRFYEIYRFEPGGKKVLVDSYQCVTAQLDQIEYDAGTDTQIQKEQYYAGEEFIKKADWEKLVDAALEKRVWKSGTEGRT